MTNNSNSNNDNDLLKHDVSSKSSAATLKDLVRRFDCKKSSMQKQQQEECQYQSSTIDGNTTRTNIIIVSCCIYNVDFGVNFFVFFLFLLEYHHGPNSCDSCNDCSCDIRLCITQQNHRLLWYRRCNRHKRPCRRT